jgi:hypothetical protein
MSYDVTQDKMESLFEGYVLVPSWPPKAKPGHVVLWRDGSFRTVVSRGKKDKLYAFGFKGLAGIDFVGDQEKILIVVEADKVEHFNKNVHKEI